MAKYALSGDAVDPSLVIDERHLLSADVYVDAKLNGNGINPGDVTLPQPLLTELAIAWALRAAAIEGAIGENSPLLDKARQYERTAELLAKSLSREALGLTYAEGSSFGSIKLGRD